MINISFNNVPSEWHDGFNFCIEVISLTSSSKVHSSKEKYFKNFYSACLYFARLCKQTRYADRTFEFLGWFCFDPKNRFEGFWKKFFLSNTVSQSAFINALTNNRYFQGYSSDGKGFFRLLGKNKKYLIKSNLNGWYYEIFCD